MKITGTVTSLCGRYYLAEKERNGNVKYHDLNFTESDVEEAKKNLKLLVECGRKDDFKEYITKYGKWLKYDVTIKSEDTNNVLW